MNAEEKLTDQWDWAVMEPELTERERALRDLFCNEYLVDFNSVAAAQRCGFQHSFAKDYAIKFMQEAYVQRRIKYLEQSAPVVGAKKEDEFNIRRIRAALLEQAYFHGPGSSHAARVSALAKLVSIYGMDAPTKAEILNVHKGGVLMVPAIANLNDWEAAAQASQAKLVSDARH